VTESSVSVTWQTPEDDGGCDVTGYVVEVREASKRSWKPAGTTPELSLTTEQLKEGSQYLFQVAAQNEVGTGPFVELAKAAVPKSDYGELGFIVDGVCDGYAIQILAYIVHLML